MKQPAGFTLIELLIVLLIIGITASIAVIRMTTSDRSQARGTAMELTHTLQLASEESLLRPAIISFVLTRCGWQFDQLGENARHEPQWQPLPEHAFAPHCLPGKLVMRLRVPGKRVIISPGGDLSPFVILIGKKNAPPDWKIAGHANGEITVSATDASS